MDSMHVRRKIVSSGVSLSDWARAVGSTKQALSRIKDGDMKVMGGPLMERLTRLVIDLESGRARFEKHPGGRHMQLRGTGSYAPTIRMRVDFSTGRLTRA